MNSERRNIFIRVTNTENNTSFDDISSYEKLIRVSTWMYRFLDNYGIKHPERAFGMLAFEELERAEILILKIVQKEAFTEIEDKRLTK
ncbi:hypothetical protein TNIN_231241 [Trichonephila inaurata madagascariensis]|uniref:Uncharacterized protein n=1 Tax=Trichonephila inaurata madagascariensis TaxID=2747483 RepID=A0A8X6XWD6_9ARAC|nr:hypothetical protein TNIN_231241 [Trichonephila inaurata madagascariensis]